MLEGMIFLADLQQINANLVGGITQGFKSGAVINAIGFLFLGIIIIGAVGAYAWWYLENKKFNIKITAFKIINGRYQPWVRDKAKIVKLGKGGFEVLFLKKLKSWKLVYGETVGKNDYYFFIDPIGYWFQGYLSADIKAIDKSGGLIPLVTTSPTMRAQYTSLEKQIDALHGQKQNFWDKYGNWVLSIGFILIMGMFVWLTMREIGGFLGSGTALAQEMDKLADTMNKLAVNLNEMQQQSGGGGIVPPPTGGGLVQP